jgi:hypothetical protein
MEELKYSVNSIKFMLCISFSYVLILIINKIMIWASDDVEF